MSEHRGAMKLATATLMDIIAKGKALQAETIRDGAPAAREALRADAHALLDAYLDHMSDAGAHTRAILED